MKKRVEVTFDRPGYVLKYRHGDIADAVSEGGKPIAQLLSDPFAGWQQLLQKGLRHQVKGITLKQASQLMDKWVDNGNTLSALGEHIAAALGHATGVDVDAEAEGGESEGNAPMPDPDSQSG
jgi:hypothetical protein